MRLGELLLLLLFLNIRLHKDIQMCPGCYSYNGCKL